MADKLFGYVGGHYLDAIEYHYNAKRTKIIKYSIKVYHKGLNTSKALSALVVNIF